MARRTELVFVGIALAAAITGVVAYTYSKDAPAKDADAEARPLVGSGGAIAASAGPVEVPRRHEVVDPSYQFTLTAPGPGWEVFDREESDAIWFGVLASAASTDGVIQVSIQQTGDLTLEVAGDRV